MRTGTESSRLDWLLLSSLCMSLVASIIALAVRKLNHSRSVLARLAMGVSMPYHVCVIGQSSCIPPPVRKSPIKMCCINAIK